MTSFRHTAGWGSSKLCVTIESGMTRFFIIAKKKRIFKNLQIKLEYSEYKSWAKTNFHPSNNDRIRKSASLVRREQKYLYCQRPRTPSSLFSNSFKFYRWSRNDSSQKGKFRLIALNGHRVTVTSKKGSVQMMASPNEWFRNRSLEEMGFFEINYLVNWSLFKIGHFEIGHFEWPWVTVTSKKGDYFELPLSKWPIFEEPIFEVIDFEVTHFSKWPLIEVIDFKLTHFSKCPWIMVWLTEKFIFLWKWINFNEEF